MASNEGERLAILIYVQFFMRNLLAKSFTISLLKNKSNISKIHPANFSFRLIHVIQPDSASSADRHDSPILSCLRSNT